eukprot:9768915-Heterocapsa_arctica.AAC.1
MGEDEDGRQDTAGRDGHRLEPLAIYGVRTVRCTTWHGVQIGLDFVVSDVTRPIVAVTDLLRRGI